MHILEAYASNTCLKIDKPFIYEKYYNVPEGKYITLENPKFHDSKTFDHWDSVIRILKPILDKNKIGIIQIGSKGDKSVKGCFDATKDVNANQMAYIIKRSLLHLGVDGFPVQLASSFNKPIVALYSNYYASHSKPYWSKDEDVVLIESDKEGDKPTYSSSEIPKTINTIKPEEVAKGVCDLLSIEFNYKYETLYTGKFFHVGLVEVVPENPVQISNMEGMPVYIRGDIKEPNVKVDSSNIDTQLSIDGKYSVIIDKPIDISILKKHQSKIDTVVFIINKSSHISFYNEVISTGIKCTLATYADEKEYNEMKFKFLDYPQITKIEIDRADEINYPEDGINKLFYQSNKYTIYNNKFYPSQAALEAGRPADKMDASAIYEVPDKSIFYKDIDHVRILRQK